MTGETKLTMQEIIDKVAARAQTLLKREARVGSSTPNRISPHMTSKRFEPVRTLELTEGEKQLFATLEDELAKQEQEQVAAAPKDPISPIKPDSIKEDEFIGRLTRLVDHFEEYTHAIETAQVRVANKLQKGSPQTVLNLSPEEVTTHWDSDEHVQASEREIAELAAFLGGLRDHSERAISELNRLICGRYGIETRSGRPAVRRGKEVGAFLLGYAVGLGLTATTSRTNEGKGSAVEALIGAFILVRQPKDPAALAVYEQLPRSYEPIAKLHQALPSDETLHQQFETGKRLGERKAQRRN
jgi:hypothetical protein